MKRFIALLLIFGFLLSSSSRVAAADLSPQAKEERYQTAVLLLKNYLENPDQKLTDALNNAINLLESISDSREDAKGLWYYAQALQILETMDENQMTMLDFFLTMIMSDSFAQTFKELSAEHTVFGDSPETLVTYSKGRAAEKADDPDKAVQEFYRNCGGFFDTMQRAEALANSAQLSAPVLREFTSDTVDGELAVKEKGVAKIKSLRGRTLVWNQLIQNGNFYDASGWIPAHAFFTANKNVASVLPQKQYGEIGRRISVASGHKYYACYDMNKNVSDLPGNTFNLVFCAGNTIKATVYSSVQTGWQRAEKIFEMPEGVDRLAFKSLVLNIDDGFEAQIQNVMLIDLTKMFGVGKEPKTEKEFRAMFPEPYYEYEEGRLLDFTGTAVKTTGFNLLDLSSLTYTDSNATHLVEQDNNIIITAPGGIKDFQQTFAFWDVPGALTGKKVCLSAQEITVSPGTADCRIIFEFFDPYGNKYSQSVLELSGNKHSATCTIPAGAAKMRMIFRFDQNRNGFSGEAAFKNICMNVSWGGYWDGEYQPYERYTFKLPALFKEGLKSVGDTYDELLPDRVIQRIRTRAYRAGDEIRNDVVTDETYTYEVLSEPIIDPIDPPIDLNYTVFDFGLEEVVSDGISAPLTALISYPRDIELTKQNETKTTRP